MSKNTMPMVGVYAFILGLIVSIIGAFYYQTWMPLLLGLIGLVVGLLNVSDKEVNSFLIATVAFLLSVTSLSVVYASIFPQLGVIFSLFGAMVAPAAAIVALKAIYALARDQ
ncbi:TPA: hypothetical protein HA318_04500 [Candidatus Micrarchaeota archaeon]|nr:hypothetical protein [Candidatus Micrarchaeota archaeon]